MNEIRIPKTLEPIVRAFFADSVEMSKALIVQGAKAIYGFGEGVFCFKAKCLLTKEELECVYSLMESIKPQDIFEALVGAQIVASHLLGIRKLAKRNKEDLRIGLNLLELSNKAIHQLQRKRSGIMQNITINYSQV